THPKGSHPAAAGSRPQREPADGGSARRRWAAATSVAIDRETAPETIPSTMPPITQVASSLPTRPVITRKITVAAAPGTSPALTTLFVFTRFLSLNVNPASGDATILDESSLESKVGPHRERRLPWRSWTPRSPGAR